MRTLLVLLVGCGGTSPPITNQAPPPARRADMTKLLVDAPRGWEGEYNRSLADWTYEKYTPGPDHLNEASRVYITPWPDDVPVDVEAYAARLSDADFQDIGYRYTAITEKAKRPDGWLIKGTVAPTRPLDADDKPQPGFVMMRAIDGARIRCKSGSMRSEQLRDEAIELCRRVKLGT